ncbi:peptide deformylase [Actinomadura parmotrematis]|uniref:Peptide deformylase n=1 Tax=Actinomadura parmotrematis TaxID=2864039 RepID=A0ABS7FXS0_9ACTN|nr:peptide deformylase [Actinomadura parmotrematis]MBW8485225.1 peptide deformylase [Actinomadura parmotrematis]
MARATPRGRARGAGHPGTARPIRRLGDPVLRTACDPVRTFDAALERLVDDMFVTMYEAEGAGLAGNQIGLARSLFVYDCEDDKGRRHVGHVVNPVLVAADGDTLVEPEGCLSLPGLRFDTPRYAHAVVEGVDAKGRPVRVEGTGYFARCLQHETGHLDGRVYVDGLDGDARRAAMRAIRESARG